MKYKLKPITKLFALSVFFLLANCAKVELDAVKHQSLTTDKISFEQFKQETGIVDFQTTIKLPNSASSTLNRTANISDFIINTDKIAKYISDKNETTYSFQIFTTDGSETVNEKFNLLYNKENNIWEQTIVSFKEQNLQFSDAEVLYSTTNKAAVCFYFQYVDGCGGRLCVGTCDLCLSCATLVMSSGSCGGESGGLSSTNPPTSGHNPNYGGGGNTTPDFIPNIENPIIPIDSNTPCQRLKIKSSQAAFKNRFNALNTSAKYALTNESGYFEEPDGNGGTTFTACAINGNSKVVIGPSATSALHVHQNETTNSEEITVKMLSVADIDSLFSCGNHRTAGGLDSLDAYIMMLSSTGVYSIMITDPNYNSILNNLNWNNLHKKYVEDAEKLKDEDGNFNPTQKELQGLLFKTLKRANLQDKVALFKATNVTPNSTATPQWARINPVTLEEEPCN